MGYTFGNHQVGLEAVFNSPVLRLTLFVCVFFPIGKFSLTECRNVSDVPSVHHPQFVLQK